MDNSHVIILMALGIDSCVIWFILPPLFVAFTHLSLLLLFSYIAGHHCRHYRACVSCPGRLPCPPRSHRFGKMNSCLRREAFLWLNLTNIAADVHICIFILNLSVNTFPVTPSVSFIWQSKMI